MRRRQAGSSGGAGGAAGTGTGTSFGGALGGAGGQAGNVGESKNGMIAGPDKNLYVEPVVWTYEWAQKHYGYPQQRSN